MNNALNLADLGRRIRAARMARRLTLEEVVSRADFTVSWLSKLENGLLAPSLEGLVKLAEVLECGVDVLVEGLSVPPRHVVVKHDHGRLVSVGDGKASLDVEHLADQWRGRTMDPTILHIAGSVNRNGRESRDGQRFLLVLDGEVKLEYGDEWIVLSKGDSIYFDATIPHAIATAGRTKARVLSVASEKNAFTVPTGGRATGGTRKKRS
jgi:transcriptional regulator with XRE-family HTH domain